MRSRTKKRTDLGIIVLHWIFVGVFLVATLTGLRIMDLSGQTIGPVIQALLPLDNFWALHLTASIGIMIGMLAYPFYLVASGRGRHLGLDRARLASLRFAGSARWGTLTILVYWALFGLLALEIGTGILLYLGAGGAIVHLHLLGTWALLSLVAIHVVVHFLFGGANQILRVFRAAPDETAMLGAGQRRRAQGAAPQQFAPRNQLILATGFFAVIVGVAILVTDRADRQILHVTRISALAAPQLDDGLGAALWAHTPPLRISTQQGANFDGTGTTVVEIRAVYDDDTAWFAFSWSDPTRSLKHMPLIKTAEGWKALSQYQGVIDPVAVASFGSHGSDGRSQAHGAFVEDKFAVMLSKTGTDLGPGAFHAGRQPLSDKPSSSSGQGLHYRTDDSASEIWLWHASEVSNRQCEHLTMGRPVDPSPDQVLGRAPYKGGIRADRTTMPSVDNFRTVATTGWSVSSVPLRLPLALDKTRAAMGDVDLDPNHGDSATDGWVLNAADSTPYSKARDNAMPVGTIIPGAVASDNPMSRHGDLQCVGRWNAGRWTVIASRRLTSEAAEDMRIGPGLFMWVAAFDHTATQHTRHVRPLKLEFSR